MDAIFDKLHYINAQGGNVYQGISDVLVKTL